MKNTIFLLILIGLFFVGVSFGQNRKVTRGKICGDPTVKCKTNEITFESYEIPFELPKNYIVGESEWFYAIILKSSKSSANENCENQITEDERLSVQKLFPSNKVFAHKCDEPGLLYYVGVKYDTVFLAVYGGKTLAEAQKFLKVVKFSGKFQGAYIKKLQAQFNGT
ncbi:MAG: hypothetical protein K1X72_10580 [Pyrinomonadaceae bacterium]|nr:hypothetical protein [Pyrinomonadaceae bacterium]